MPYPGSILLSLRGDGPWKGHTTLTVSDRGERRQQLLENCYVSGDGNEVRSIWGWKTVVDCVTQGFGYGHLGLVTDAFRPAYVAAANIPAGGGGTSYYNEHNTNPALNSEKQYVWAPIAHSHSITFVGGRLLHVGETGFRREPILAAGVPIRATAWERVAGVAVLTMNSTTFTATVGDGEPTGVVNGVAPDGNAATPGFAVVPSYVYIEIATGTGPVSELVGLVHQVDLANSAAGTIALTTPVTAAEFARST